MSLRVPGAAVRAYDALKQRPGAHPRHSDARDPGALEAIRTRIGELISSYRIGVHHGAAGGTFVFWTEILAELDRGAFDDLLDRL